LQVALEPLITTMVRRHRDMRRKGLSERYDDLADVRTAALERLAAHEFQNLRMFAARSADALQPESFESWIYGLVDYAVRDHLRQRFGRAPKEAVWTDVRPSKRDLQSHAGRLDFELKGDLQSVMGVTARLSLAQVQSFIAETFSPVEINAVKLYYSQGQSHEELARALSLPDAKHAEQLIRRLNARLRYRFAPQS
jgi:hypothetical protein